MTSAEEKVEYLFALYKRFGSADYIGEPVSQIEHMSQAAELAMQEGYDDEVVLAAFFHDIGHICVLNNQENSMGGYGIKSHEKIGADFLRSLGFSERIARLVESHVQAKRYLTYKYPEYLHSLSEASRKTLVYQGGIMDDAEAHHFEKDPLFNIIIRMRQWDELAKEEHIPVIDINVLRQKSLNVLREHNSGVIE